MSKLSFRARALDASKLMPIYKAEEIPELPDFAAINRAVPQMPTGMEKEEEAEHHLQRALSAQQVYGTAESLVIPIPEMEDVAERYHELYSAKGDFKPPKQFIHVQPWGMDQEIPDYDMDSEDETWLNKQAKNLKMEVSSLKFENMMDRLEKGSGQTVVTLNEAKALLKEDDDLTIAVYDYWLNKRLRLQHALIPQVKTEKRDGSTTNNPYVAFRRRTEKMQTRKNRKNDETSYEKMLKLRRDLKKALTILELIKRRDKSKKELLQLTIEIVDKRCQMQDWEGKALVEALAQRHKMHSFLTLQNQIPMGREWGRQEDGVYVKKKREYKKRKHKLASISHATPATQQPTVQLPHYNEGDMMQHDGYSTEEEGAVSPSFSTSDHETDDDPDGIYAFRRKAGCAYHAPISEGCGNWPWHAKDDGGSEDQNYRYSLGSISQPRHCVGFTRRRVGRGGRVLLDRAHSVWDKYLNDLDFGVINEAEPITGWTAEYINYIKDNNIPHFRPKTPTDEQNNSASIHPAFRDSMSPMLGLEFNAELFHTHQEQLLQMQRQQQEQLLHQDTTDIGSFVDLEHSFSPPHSRFTLDSATALFAASAVCNSASELKDTSPSANTLGTSTLPISDSPTPTSHFGATASSLSLPAEISGLGSGDTLVNGPSKLESKSGGFSTSPAANVLQLNFPMSSLTKTIDTPVPSLTTKDSASPSPASTSSSQSLNLKSSASITSVGYSTLTDQTVSPAIATKPYSIVTQVSMTPSIATKAVTPTAPTVLKLASTPNAHNDTIPRENHEGVNSVSNVTAMEVT